MTILPTTMSVTMLMLLPMVSYISAQCLTVNDNPANVNTMSQTGMTNARFGFALDSLRKSALIEKTDNIFYSPHSLYQALTLAYFGSRGTTESAVKTALHIPQELSKIDVQRYYAYENAIKRQKEEEGTVNSNYEYKSANRLWLSGAKKLRECMFNFFGNELEVADFMRNPDGVRLRINEWVSNTTKGHIRDLLPSGAIAEDTDMVLANAVYFKGLWKSKFLPENSKKDIFYASGSKNAVTTFMSQKGTFNHVVSEELGAHILELPYKGDEISMYVLLPPFSRSAKNNKETASSPEEDNDSVSQLIKRISSEKGSERLREFLNDGILPREVEVLLPRFEIERELPLVQLLRAMGAGVLVDIGQADLRGFVADGESSLSLGDAVHRARIEVNEEGTTAAAATALLSFRSSRPSEPAVFNANHPFLYIIYDKKASSILFAGIYRTPNNPSSTEGNAATP